MNRFFCSLFLLFLISCKEQSSNIVQEKNVVYGGKKYGSVFRFSVPDNINSFFPLSSTTLYDQQLSSLCFEPLFKYNDDLILKGVVASSYEFDEDKSVLRIIIKKNILFHDSPVLNVKERLVTAHDVAFSIALACSAHEKNRFSTLFENKIIGFDEFYSRSKNKAIDYKNLKGIRVLNDTTLELKTTCSKTQILEALANPSMCVLSSFAYKKLGDKFFYSYIGTGPFFNPVFSPKSVRFSKNTNYHVKDEFGNKLPFLSGVEVFFKDQQVQDFEKGIINVIQNASSNDLESLFGSLEKTLNNSNVLHKSYVLKDKEFVFLAFNERIPPFNSVNFRRRIASSIQRDSLAFYIDDGVSPKLRFIKDSINPKTAFRFSNKGHLSGFPLAFIYPHSNNAKEELSNDLVYKQISSSNPEICIKKSVSIDSLFTFSLDSSMSVFKLGWVPESKGLKGFLGLFYSRSSFAKHLGIEDQTYDLKYQNLLSDNSSDSMKIIAENRLLEQCHFVPLFSRDMIFIANIEMRDFSISSSGLFNLERVYKKPVQNLIYK